MSARQKLDGDPDDRQEEVDESIHFGYHGQMQPARTSGNPNAVQPSKRQRIPSLAAEPEPPPARLTRAARSANKHLAGGPIDDFDRELIGFVCRQSDDYGSGFEGYDAVAALPRAQRAELWAALSPLLEQTVELSERQRPDQAKLAVAVAAWSAACARLDIWDSTRDMFLLDKDAWTRAHVVDSDVRARFLAGSAIDAAPPAENLARLNDLDQRTYDSFTALLAALVKKASGL
jgi:hypothetical protein